MIHKATLLLGTNLGNRDDNLRMACELISKDLGVLSKQSSIYKTAAWGKIDQPDFLNQVIIIETTRTSQALIKGCLAIEVQMGRIRKHKWGERIIDIDILYFDDEIIYSTNLAIPHPGIPNRRFTLVPLVEIAPNYLHPILNNTHEALLEECNDKSEVELYLGQN
ncbi:MAG: 2-amino-4-hydroxy-6-hydroxymethyldihydropteridine diphosphokinase [Bacteroidetes bacterium]|nr:2-amino-4-hydroxy-6-hydroxymethyldihydropteridine diphosphokinase [Bacteroidota bacterium]MDA1119108.1 2-amino-4-hydroxy-6-hydroxymethyldihydropteridine diphosphokinase [Bacteroidota bacterium]